jgi:cyanate lyase
VFRDVLSKIEILLMFCNIIGLTFDQIAKSIGRDEVWVAAAFYGQVNIGWLKTTKLVHIL